MEIATVMNKGEIKGKAILSTAILQLLSHGVCCFVHFLLYLTLLNLQITIFTSKEICLLSVVEYKEHFMVKSDDDSVVTSILLKCRILSISFLQLFVHLSH